MTTIRLTAAQAMIRYLMAQLSEDGTPFLTGCWGIFGHGNVAGLGEALQAVKDRFPTYRGQNEQTMARLPMPSNWAARMR
jgi:3D-(3,5/4)-trihydroxycyclohexane-1,2-dione acylhydrolase (decyclizing)